MKFFNWVTLLVFAISGSAFLLSCEVIAPTGDDDDNDTSELEGVVADDDDNDDEFCPGGELHPSGACVIYCDSSLDCPGDDVVCSDVWPICVPKSGTCYAFGWIAGDYGCRIDCSVYNECPDQFYCTGSDEMEEDVCLWDSTGGSGGDSCGCCETCDLDCDWCGTDIDCYTGCYGDCMQCCENCY